MNRGIALIASLALLAFGGAAAAAAAAVLPGASNTATADSANAPPPVPTLVGPADGAAGETLPAFAWSPVTGADRYEFQIAADAGFNAPVLGAGSDQFQTRNTRATLKSTVPNGRYWWRVRSVSAAGEVSACSPGRSY